MQLAHFVFLSPTALRSRCDHLSCDHLSCTLKVSPRLDRGTAQLLLNWFALPSSSTRLYSDIPMYRVSIHDNKCIAPSPKRERCTLPIDDHEAQEILSLVLEVQRSGTDRQTEGLLQRIALLRCCGEYHRQKLEADRRTLVDLARKYARLILGIPEMIDPTQESPRLVIPPCAGTDKPRYCLRPRKAGDSLQAEVDLEFDSALFVPYPSRPKDDLKGVLTSNLSKSDMQRGNVYAFSWPAAPGYIKIGKSRNVGERLSAWEKCHPGAILIYSITVPQAKRVERLIHLEMSRERHQIIMCSSCGRTHYEWFKRPMEEVKEVMRAWEQVMNDVQPYNQDGRFNKPLEESLSWTKHELTAKRILGLYYATAVTPKITQGFEKNLRHIAPIVDTECLKVTTNGAVLANSMSRRSSLPRRDWDLVVLFFYDFWRTI